MESNSRPRNLLVLAALLLLCSACESSRSRVFNPPRPCSRVELSVTVERTDRDLLEPNPGGRLRLLDTATNAVLAEEAIDVRKRRTEFTGRFFPRGVTLPRGGAILEVRLFDAQLLKNSSLGVARGPWADSDSVAVANDYFTATATCIPPP